MVDVNKPKRVAEFFKDLDNSREVVHVTARNEPLPETVRDIIQKFVDNEKITHADFLVVRSRPGDYDKKCYAWLWLLHRAMNHHGKELFK